MSHEASPSPDLHGFRTFTVTAVSRVLVGALPARPSPLTTLRLSGSRSGDGLPSVTARFQ